MSLSNSSIQIEDNTISSTNYKYAVLMETNGEECESWYYCIRYQGNEENLNHLQKQLEMVDWYIIDDLSTFDLDLEHLISETTAKELTKLELNHVSFHRKFDGVLDRIDLNIKEKDNNERKMVKAFDILSYGQIEDFVDKEDLDEEDLTDISSSDNEEEKDESNDEYSDDKDDDNLDSDNHSDKDSDKDSNSKYTKKLPKTLFNKNTPRVAKFKRRQRNNK